MDASHDGSLGTGRALQVAWVAYCCAIVAAGVVSDSIPFMGSAGLFAVGGRGALRIGAFGVPLAVALAAWGVALFRQQVQPRYTPFLWWLLGLGGLMSLATVFAMDPTIALFGWQVEEQGLILWLLYLVLAALGSQLVSSPRRVRQLSLAVVGGAVYVAALGVSEVLGARPNAMVTLDTLWMLQRGMSTMMNPDLLGTYLVVPALLGVAVTVGCRGRSRIAAGAGTAVVVLGLVLTLVRGAWLGLFAGLVSLSVLIVAVGWYAHRKPGAASAAQSPFDGAGYCPSGGRAVKPDVRVIGVLWGTLVLVVAAAVAASPSIDGLFSRFVDPIGDSGRIPLWTESLQAVWSRPLLGAGPDNFLYAWQRCAGEATIRSNGVILALDSPHNVFLEIAVQFGLPVLVLAVGGVLWLCVRSIRRVIPQVANGSTHGWEVLGVVAAVAALGVSLTVGMVVMPIMVGVFTVVGMLMGIDARPVTRVRSAAVTNGIATGAVVVAVVAGAWAGLSGASAVLGNQAAPTYAVRTERNLAALSVAPWRLYPKLDLVKCALNLTPQQQQMYGLTAESAYLRLIDAEPLKSLHRFNYGDYMLLSSGNPPGALEQAETALRLQPVSAPGLMLRGDARIALGQRDEGLADLREAVRLESMAQERHSWDAPWVAYMSALADDAIQRGSDQSWDAASATFAAFRIRFPDNPFIPQFERVLAQSQ